MANKVTFLSFFGFVGSYFHTPFPFATPYPLTFTHTFCHPYPLLSHTFCHPPREQPEQPDPEFPLVVTSVSVPWFEPETDYTSAKQRAAAARSRAERFGSDPVHVVFVGLAFLSRRVLTIDTDTLRMTAELPGPEKRPRSFG